MKPPTQWRESCGAAYEGLGVNLGVKRDIMIHFTPETVRNGPYDYIRCMGIWM